MDSELRALQASAARLRQLVEPLVPEDLDAPAYPSEWSIADVMSHLGSGAVIMQRRLDDGLAGRNIPDDFAPVVWDEWNARSQTDKARGGLAADRTLIDRVEALTADERARFSFSMGPLTFDANGLVALRLNEHTLHTWDIEVARKADATLPPEGVALVIDNLDLIGRFTARPNGGDARQIEVQTSEPARRFTIDVGQDTVTFATGSATAETEAPPDLELPAEAFIRLIYGRLDRDHTPDFTGDAAALDRLRHVFPGP